jgi:hypothetical protein
LVPIIRPQVAIRTNNQKQKQDTKEHPPPESFAGRCCPQQQNAPGEWGSAEGEPENQKIHQTMRRAATADSTGDKRAQNESETGSDKSAKQRQRSSDEGSQPVRDFSRRRLRSRLIGSIHFKPATTASAPVDANYGHGLTVTSV